MRAPASICLFHGTEPGGQGEFLYFICLCHVSLCLLVSPGPRLGLPIVLAFSIFHLAFPSAPSLPASLLAPPSVRRACALVDPGRSFRMVGPWSCRDGGLLPLACPPAAPLPAKWPQGISLPGPRLTCRGRSPSVTFLLYLSGRGCGNREEAAGDPWHSLNQHSEPEQIPRLCKTARIGSQEGSQAGAASKILSSGEADSQEEGQRLLYHHNLPQWLCCGCPAEEADLFSWQGQILAREETQEDSKHTFQNSRGSHGMGKENPAPVLVSLLMAL